MKIIYSLCLVASLLGFKNSHAQSIEADTAHWIKSFTAFRTAVYNNNKQKVKSFIDFPLISEFNQIWQLVDQGNKQPDKTNHSSKAFTEDDFNTYYNKLFPATFKKAIMTIKSGELKKKGEAESAASRYDKSTTYKMYATLDSTTQTLTLALGFQRTIKNKKGEPDDHEEYGIVYTFSILSNGQLKFTDVALTA